MSNHGVPMQDRIQVVEGDITKQQVDAISTLRTLLCSVAVASTARFTARPAPNSLRSAER